MVGVDLYLVRHGESLSNVEHRLCGEPPGPELSERGRLQAEIAAASLMPLFAPPARIVTSPLLRTWQTADALARKVGRPAAIVADLRETFFGPWEGRTAAELADDPAYPVWAADPDRSPPWVESVASAGERVERALSLIARDMGRGTLVAYSHQHPILGLVRRMGLAADEAWLPNCAIVHAVWEDGAFRWGGIDTGVADGRPLVAFEPVPFEA
jgi:broad specificity phosphatase PhoE